LAVSIGLARVRRPGRSERRAKPGERRYSRHPIEAKKTQELTMRFIITAGKDEKKTEADAPVDEKLLVAYMKFNEEMHQAGVLVASEGLNPAAPGARVVASHGKRKIVDGPFTESKELVGGFYIVDVPSLDDAVAWALRCPCGMGSDDVLEIRQLTGEQDLPPEILKIIETAAPTWSASFRKGRKD
jgi:hypothetical protein